ncbi:MAG: 3-deoxy-8-phosphooctulonate synthase [Fusobacteria bacterium]|nr:3-deoxy-8-phosphooctulonate synthase [Fusobacteriota bacterium]
MRDVKVGNITFSNDKPFVLIAGPCVMESEELVMEMAEKIQEICTRLEIPFIFKSSFDKANRSSIYSFRGPGIEKGLELLGKVKKRFNIPVLTDVHTEEQATEAGKVVDVLQIPAFLCRQTDLLIAAAKTGKMVNVKKGQFLAPWDMKQVVKKFEECENFNVTLCERGTTFGYNNLVVDMRSMLEMKKMDYPVVFDATHSVQKPGGNGTTTGGDREYVFPLMKAALSLGIAAVFAEVHPDPDNAKSDGPNMLKLENLEEVLITCKAIDKLIKGY